MHFVFEPLPSGVILIISFLESKQMAMVVFSPMGQRIATRRQHVL
jgi:hypothetical protein